MEKERPKVQRRAHKVSQVAEALGGINKEHVYRLLHSGRLGYVRVGRHYLIPDEELQRFVKDTQRGVEN